MSCWSEGSETGFKSESPYLCDLQKVTKIMTTEKVQKPRLFKIPTIYTKPCSHSNFISVYITQKDFLVYRGVHGFWCFPFLVTLHTMIVYFYEILMGVGSRAAKLLYKQNIIGKGNLICRGAKEGARSGRECLPLSLLLCHQFLSVALLQSSLHSTWLSVCWSRHPDRPRTPSLLLPLTLSAPIPNSQGRALIGQSGSGAPLIQSGVAWGGGHIPWGDTIASTVTM